MVLQLSNNTRRVLADSLARVAPFFSGRIVYNAWAQVTRTQRPEREEACFHQAKKTALNIDNENIVVYSWGNGPLILFVHGWSGRATQAFLLIEKLLTEGYQVLAFDGPGHGESSGNRSSLNQLTNIIKKISNEYGEFEVIIAHSFGFMVSVNVLGLGVKSKAVIGFSSPADYSLLVKAYVDYLALNIKAEYAFYQILKKTHGLQNFDDISVHHLAEKIKLPCLIVHDENDRQVPVSEAHKIINAWQGAELYLTKGFGHSRILYNQDAINQCIAFLNKIKMC